MKPRVSSGFTLIELMIAVVIIALLSVASIAGYSRQQIHARDARRIVDIGTVGLALENYFAIKGDYPTSPSAGGSYLLPDVLGDLINKGTITTLPTDPKIGGGSASSICAGYIYASSPTYPATDTFGGQKVETRDWSLVFGTELGRSESTDHHLLDSKIWVRNTGVGCTDPRSESVLLGTKKS